MREINYNDNDEINKILVGRTITGITEAKATDYLYPGYGEMLNVVTITLDDGTRLIAQETDGGCSCSNGCWSMEKHPESDRLIGATILNAEVVEEPGEYEDEATMRLFVYADFGKSEVYSSEGHDNGYYGWGYHLFVQQKGES